MEEADIRSIAVPAAGENAHRRPARNGVVRHLLCTVLAISAALASFLGAPGSFVASDAAPSVLGTPAVAVDAYGNQYVFWQGPDHRLWNQAYTSGNWGGESELTWAGELGSSPTATAHGAPAQVDVFWEGTDGYVWEAWWESNTWYGPIRPASSSSTFGVSSQLNWAPTTASSASGEQWIFWRGGDGYLNEAWYTPGTGWNGPTDFGPGRGTLSSPPSVEVDSSGFQYVFWQGSDSKLWEDWYTGSWHGPADLGFAANQPAAAWDPSGTQLVFWNLNGALWEAWYAGYWTVAAIPIRYPETLTSAPGVGDGGTQQNVFWQGSQGGIDEAYYVGQGNQVGWYGAIQIYFANGFGPGAATAQESYTACFQYDVFVTYCFPGQANDWINFDYFWDANSQGWYIFVNYTGYYNRIVNGNQPGCPCADAEDHHDLFAWDDYSNYRTDQVSEAGPTSGGNPYPPPSSSDSYIYGTDDIGSTGPNAEFFDLGAYMTPGAFDGAAFYPAYWAPPYRLFHWCWTYCG